MRIRNHLTYANVTATIAVFGVVSGGGAYAASKIDTNEIANKAITAKKLDHHAVKGGKLRADAVTSAKLADGAVTDSNLSDEIRASVAVAGLSVSADGTVESWFNRVGDEPQVLHGAAGRYELSIPGTDVSTAGVQAATLEGDQAGEISVKRQLYSVPPATPLILTRDSMGTPANRAFSYLLFDGEQDLPN